MSLRFLLWASLAIALSAPRFTTVGGQEPSGVGVNSDAGPSGNIVLNEVNFSAPKPSILLRLAVLECDPKKTANAGFDNWPAQFSELVRRGSMEATRAQGKICTLNSTVAAECFSLLQRAGVGRIVSEPSIVTENGRQATLQIGGQIALPTLDPGGESKVEYRNVGLELTTTPQYADGRFRIDLQLVHNALESSADDDAPTIRQHKVLVTLGIAPGQTALIGQVSLENLPTSSEAKSTIVFLTPEVINETSPTVAVAMPANVGNAYLIESLKGVVELIENAAIVVEAPRSLINYRVDDPAVIAVRHVNNQSNQVRIEAKGSGETTLKLTDDRGTDYTLKVIAQRDQDDPMRLIARLYPDSQVKIIPVRTTAIVRGTVGRAEDAEQIAEIVSQFFPGALNHLRVAAPAAPSPLTPPQPTATASNRFNSKEWLGLKRSSIPQVATPDPTSPPLALAMPPLPATPALPVPALPPATPISPQPVMPHPNYPNSVPTLPVPATPAAFDSLRGLHDEVKLLRRDVNRLIDLLEKRLDDKTKEDEGGAAADAPHVLTEPAATEEPPLPERAAPARSNNFVASHGIFTEKERIESLAETLRGYLAAEWLGKSLPHWEEPCAIDVSVSQRKAGGATSFMFRGRQIFGMRMSIGGPPDQLAGVLSHEVMHAVLATHFGQPLPRWIDEGIAVTVEGGRQRELLTKQFRQAHEVGRLLPLRRLFDLREYDADGANAMIVHAQGAVLVAFFLERGNKRQLVEFVEDALAGGDWEAAMQRHYGIATFDELEKIYREHALANETS